MNERSGPELDNAMLRGDWWSDQEEPFDWYDILADQAADEHYSEADDDEADNPTST